MLTGQLALLTAALFAGAALYVSVAEQPARLLLDDRALLDRMEARLQKRLHLAAPLAVVGCLLGLAAWWRGGHAGWLVRCVAHDRQLALHSLVVIMPTNRKLMAMDPASA